MEKESVLTSVLQKLSSSLTAKRSAVLPAEYVIKTVLTDQYLKIATEDMWLTGPNVTAVECVCTTALQTTLLLRMELSRVSVHVVEFAQKSVQAVLTVGKWRNPNRLP